MIKLKNKLEILLCRILGRGYLGILVGHCNGCVRYEFNEKSLTRKNDPERRRFINLYF